MDERALRIWCIRAGERSEAEVMFLGGTVALDGEDLGDLSSIPNNLAAFKQRFRTVFPGEVAGTTSRWARQYLQFVHEVERQDWIVYKSKRTQMVHFGHITGAYRFQPQAGLDHAHLRPVRWVGSQPWGTLGPLAKKALSSRAGFCGLKSELNDVLAAIARLNPTTGA
ncbi:MAG: hypothetical protein LW650_04350 [Planctomycetaceae bacterium]|jgi:predicted Mrr-cat superfamily restriction endonuclease|nr:hypothetical protein [Phycisphaerales bacterium]MCE2652738.1 hypothetical protein [Planctomycetaceae bacterium]